MAERGPPTTTAIAALIEAAVAHAATLHRHARADADDVGARTTEAEAARWQAMADAARIELAALR